MLARRGTRCAPVAAARPVTVAPRPTVPIRAASSGQGKATRMPFNMFDLPHKWLSGVDTPSTKEQFKYTTYHKYGTCRSRLQSRLGIRLIVMEPRGALFSWFGG